MGQVVSDTLYKANQYKYFFECPGCGCLHFFNTNLKESPCWSWNENPERPTFTPSLVVNANNPSKRCHLNVTNGNIVFHSDSFHSLKGQTVPMVPHWFQDKN